MSYAGIKMIAGQSDEQLASGLQTREILRGRVCLVVELLSRGRLFVTPRTAACQAPLSMEFSRQEYWSG